MKGIKYILGALATASLLVFSFNANAQENANRDEDGNVVRGAYETNKAFDNTFLGVGVGVNSVIGSIRSTDSWGKIGIAGALNFGKWWTPSIGARIGYQGITNKSRKNVDIYDGERYFQHYVHADFLWNISNTIGGYKETRLWNFVPYATMGVLDVNKDKFFGIQNLEYAAGAGLLNVIRLTDRINATLDFKGLVGRGHAYTKHAGYFVLFPSALIGLNFNFGKTNFDRHSSITPVVIPVPFTTEQYNALADKVKALEAENAALKDKVAALENELAPFKNLVNGQTYLYENGTFTAVDIKQGAPVSVYFDLGSAKISNREKAHLDYFVNSIDADTNIDIKGYADKWTGSAKVNQDLSEKRAKAVADYLKKAGINGNISCDGLGATDQFNKPAYKNRVATIEIQ